MILADSAEYITVRLQAPVTVFARFMVLLHCVPSAIQAKFP
jgi:hypothetical protein